MSEHTPIIDKVVTFVAAWTFVVAVPAALLICFNLSSKPLVIPYLVGIGLIVIFSIRCR